MIAGTASSVIDATPVLLRYQVAWSARSARFGYIARSMWPVPSRIDDVGNSSSTTTTTGAPVPAFVLADATLVERSRSPAGDENAKRNANTSGANAAYIRNRRVATNFAWAMPASTPATTDTTIRSATGHDHELATICSTSAPTRMPTNTCCTIVRTRSP